MASKNITPDSLAKAAFLLTVGAAALYIGAVVFFVL